MPSAARWFERRGRQLRHRSVCVGWVVIQADGTEVAWEGALCTARRKANPLGKEAPKAKSKVGREEGQGGGQQQHGDKEHVGGVLTCTGTPRFGACSGPDGLCDLGQVLSLLQA